MNTKKLALIAGAILIVIGLIKPNLSNLISWPSRPVAIDVLELPAPTVDSLKKEADEVVSLLRSYGASKADLKRLRDLMLDLRRLIELDGEDAIIKNTEEIRQANSLSGMMLRLDIKGKYPDLAKESKDVVVAAIGDDNINLSPELREKAMDSFHALAWAYNEASK